MDDGSCKTYPPVRQLNDSVYELYKPSGWASMKVVLFHGFQLGDINYEIAHLTTWQSGDASCIWPQTWLVDEFPGAHILSVSYHGCLRTRREDGNIDNYSLAEKIMSDLRQANIGQDAGCPVILIGHGFGGLVLKHICWHAYTKSSTGSVEEANFLKNVNGLFFYSTPHHGIASRLAARFVSQGPLLDYVKTLSTDAARMNESFEELRKYYHTWKIAGLGENLQTKVNTFKIIIVVAEHSSRYGEDFEIVATDHIFICRPMRKTSKGFYRLTGFLGKFRNRLGFDSPFEFSYSPFSQRADELITPFTGTTWEIESLGTSETDVSNWIGELTGRLVSEKDKRFHNEILRAEPDSPRQWLLDRDFLPMSPVQAEFTSRPYIPEGDSEMGRLSFTSLSEMLMSDSPRERSLDRDPLPISPVQDRSATTSAYIPPPASRGPIDRDLLVRTVMQKFEQAKALYDTDLRKSRSETYETFMSLKREINQLKENLRSQLEEIDRTVTNFSHRTESIRKLPKAVSRMTRVCNDHMDELLRKTAGISKNFGEIEIQHELSETQFSKNFASFIHQSADSLTD